MTKLLFVVPVVIVAFGLSIPSALRSANAEEPVKAEESVEKLIADLGHDDFRVREAASRKLAALGEQARAALAKAAKSNGSLETRWRAQQLLRRLSGDKATKPVDPAQPGPVPGNPFGFGSEEEMEKLKRGLEELQKRFGGRLVRGPGMSSTLRRPVKVQGLELKRVPEGVSLTVDAWVNGVNTPKSYVGRTLADILKLYPQLKSHAQMKALQEKVKAQDPFRSFRDMLSGFGRLTPGSITSFSRGNGVSMTSGADGVTVTVTERDENGKSASKTYRGKTLSEIKQNHPEIADKLKGLSMTNPFDFRIMKPLIFGGRRGREVPPKPQAISPTQGPFFGVGIETPDELLSMHLGLEKGHAVIVKYVVEGSQAEKLGMQRGDILVSIDDQKLVNVAQAARLLQQATKNSGALRVELIRRGKRETLTR